MHHARAPPTYLRLRSPGRHTQHGTSCLLTHGLSLRSAAHTRLSRAPSYHTRPQSTRIDTRYGKCRTHRGVEQPKPHARAGARHTHTERQRSAARNACPERTLGGQTSTVGDDEPTPYNRSARSAIDCKRTDRWRQHATATRQIHDTHRRQYQLTRTLA